MPGRAARYRWSVSELGDLLALLHGADSSWRSVGGEVREWRNQQLVHRAFMDEARASGGKIFTVGSGEAPETFESTYRLWTDGERTRVEREPTHEARPELLVRVGPVWWSFRSDHGAVTNDGADNVGSGGDEIRAHLRPSMYLGRFRWSVVDRDTIAGRSCVIARAEERSASDRRRDFLPPAFDMISGGKTFDVAVDEERGVLLRVTKTVEGHPAEIREFVDIEFDLELPAELFIFRAPDGSQVQSFDAYRRRISGE